MACPRTKARAAGGSDRSKAARAVGSTTRSSSKILIWTVLKEAKRQERGREATAGHTKEGGEPKGVGRER